jgi:DNA-3-methyladenine glycosylase II
MTLLARIDSVDDLELALRELTARDLVLARVLEAAGMPPLRRREAGFEGLARIVVSQQLSVASADAIWMRVREAVSPFEASRLADISDDALRAAGLSAPKIRTLRDIGAAIVERRVDLETLPATDAAEAHAQLCAIRGIGPWTADIYLLFCHGHPDVWPAGDLALQHAVGHAMGLDGRPNIKVMEEIAERWRPWRGVAARLFWAYYRVARGRAGIAV